MKADQIITSEKNKAESRIEKVYFPNLNGIRFIAASVVIISHIELINHLLGDELFISLKSVVVIGRLGVILFFVLSGFLITYLLLEEEKKKGIISIKQFYMRRIMRIWPLYYLLLFFSFFIFHKYLPSRLVELDYVKYVGKNFLLYLLFIPNIAVHVFPRVWGMIQTWSIGVEEQFYLIWPLLFLLFKNKLKMIIGFIFTYELVKFIIFRLIKKYIYWDSNLEVIREIWDKSFTVQCMAIGAIFAYLLFEKKILF